MKTIELGKLRARVVGEGGDTTVVLMHGFGAPGTDLVGLADDLQVPAGVRFVFPEAPLSLPPELGAGRAWWMIDMERLAMAQLTGVPRDMTREVPEGLAEARALVVDLLDVLEKDHGMTREKLLLGGFSQGAMLACDVALRTEQPLGGLALMSSTYLAEHEWAPLMSKRAELSVLMSHGRQDPLLDFSFAERLRDALVSAGLEMTWVPFDGGHGIAPSVLRCLEALVEEVHFVEEVHGGGSEA